jgi:hypothetical protein
MGTPHAGSSIAEWDKIITGLCQVLKRTKKDTINVLRPGTEVLADLQQEFHTMLNTRQKQSETKPIKIFCFFEELPVDATGEVRNNRRFPLSFDYCMANHEVEADRSQARCNPNSPR